MLESFLGKICEARVRVWRETAREEGEERETREKMRESGSLVFYIAGGAGRF